MFVKKEICSDSFKPYDLVIRIESSKDDDQLKTFLVKVEALMMREPSDYSTECAIVRSLFNAMAV